MSTTCQAPAAECRTPVLRPAVCVAFFAVAVLFFGPGLLHNFRPGPEVYPDFVQEWLSARNYWAGDPVYAPQRAAMNRHTGADLPAFDTELPWNVHPPVAVMAALPFGLIPDYASAHLAWNLVTFPLFVLSLLLVGRELGVGTRWWSACACVALIVSWSAVHFQVFQGQLNFVILSLLVAAWVADRRGYQVAAGAAVGAAAAAKLFPALLLVYFVAAGRWRAAATAVLAGLSLNLLALALFGPGAFETYARAVLPSLDVFRASWVNVALTGYWTRVGLALGQPAGGAAAAVVCQLAVVGTVWWAGRRASGPDGRDRAFALAVAGMPLASPVAWTHYFVILLIPLALAWRRTPPGPALGVLLAAGAVLWLPERYVPELFVGPGGIPANGRPTVCSPVMAVVALGPFTYALAVLFVLVALVRVGPAPATRPDP